MIMKVTRSGTLLCHKYCKIPRFDKTVDKHVTVIALKGVIVVVFNRFDKSGA